MASSYLWEAGDEDLNSLRGRWDHPTARASSLTAERQQGMMPRSPALSKREINLPQYWRKLLEMGIFWDKMYFLPLLLAAQN